jgi:hypothetical protein
MCVIMGRLEHSLASSLHPDPATSLQQRWVAAAVLLLSGQETATRQLTSLPG